MSVVSNAYYACVRFYATHDGWSYWHDRWRGPRWRCVRGVSNDEVFSSVAVAR